MAAYAGSHSQRAQHGKATLERIAPLDALLDAITDHFQFETSERSPLCNLSHWCSSTWTIFVRAVVHRRPRPALFPARIDHASCKKPRMATQLALSGQTREQAGGQFSSATTL
jgi:hypothetical protein